MSDYRFGDDYRLNYDHRGDRPDDDRIDWDAVQWVEIDSTMFVRVSMCRWVPFDEGHSIAGPGWRCSECGLELGPENVFVVERCYCCPGCCSKVVG